jgi:hypothetical protein
MMFDRYFKQFNFQYPYLVMARVTGVYALTNERKLLVDVSALDNRGSWQRVPASMPPGMTRNYRKGQIVGLLFRHTSSEYPMAIAHLNNLETDARYTDPVPPPYEYVDDHVFYHPETGAFIRHRSASSTASAGGGDAQPGITEITLASGHTIIADETPGKQSVMVKSASGHATKLDDVAKTVTTTSAGGHKVLLDDLNHVVSTVSAAGHTFKMDEIAQTITHSTIGATETSILDKETGEIAHVAGTVALGDRAVNLPAPTAAIANSHLTQYSSNVDAMRLADMIAMGGHIQAANIPNASNLVAILAGLSALTKIGVPAGSDTVKLKL